MRLTTKGRFAFTAMIYVALWGTGGPVTLAAVADRQKISLSYLEPLFGKLRRAGLVESVRGPGGGYRLARSPQGISIADVIIAVDEPIDATQCGGRESCQEDGERCMTHELCSGLNAHIFTFLRGVSLAQLVQNQKKPEPSVLQDHRAPAAGKLGRDATIIRVDFQGNKEIEDAKLKRKNFCNARFDR